MTTPEQAGERVAVAELIAKVRQGGRLHPYYVGTWDDVERAMVILETLLAREQAAVARERANATNMAATLEWLDRRGGLGYDAHDRITAALTDYRAAAIEARGQKE